MANASETPDEGAALRRFAVLREEAQAKWRAGDAEGSLRASRAALRAVRGLEYQDLLAPGILIGQGTMYRALGRYPQAERVLRRALRLVERMDDDLLRASVFSAQAALHMVPADALRAARLAVRAVRPDPYYWGAFICQGDPGTGA